MKKILIMMFLSLMSINVLGEIVNGVYIDRFRHTNSNIFDINNVSHFAKEYTQFKDKEDSDPTKYYLDDLYKELEVIPENLAKAKRIKNIISIVDCSLEELDNLININALKALYLDPHIAVTCLDENDGSNCLNNLNENYFYDRIRPLRQEIYKRITTPFEITILDWIITQRMDSAIWRQLNLQELSQIEDPKKRIERFKKDSEEIWNKEQWNFFNYKTASFNTQYTEYMRRINYASLAYLKNITESLNNPNVILINNSEPDTSEQEPDGICGSACEISGGVCYNESCFCWPDTDEDSFVDQIAVDTNSDGKYDYCMPVETNDPNYQAGDNCEFTKNENGEICNGHGRCIDGYGLCECDTNKGYYWHKGNCVGFYLNLLENDPISKSAFENATGGYAANESEEGRYYATEIWPGWKDHEYGERVQVAKEAKPFFDKIRIGDVLNVRGLSTPIKYLITPFRGFFHHTTMATKDLDVDDGYVIDPFDKAFISSRGDGVQYEPRRMYQYLLNDSKTPPDGYFYTPQYYVITVQTPEETMFGWKITMKKISLFWGWLRISIPIPFFYTERPSLGQRKDAVAYARKQQEAHKPYNPEHTTPADIAVLIAEIAYSLVDPIGGMFILFNQYETDAFYCTSLVWRSWDKVEDELFWGFDIDSTLNPTVFPADTYTDWNMGKERVLIYSDLLDKAYVSCQWESTSDSLYCDWYRQNLEDFFFDDTDIQYVDGYLP